MSNSWEQLGIEALNEIHQRFGHRLLGIPYTWIASPAASAKTTKVHTQRAGISSILPAAEWHYWWQAHYLDAICDAGFHLIRCHQPAAALAELKRGNELLRGIWLRNFGRFPNEFFDDMAWLALSSFRLNELSRQLGKKPSALTRSAQKVLTKQLYSAHDAVLDGGLYWSRERTFKNTPVNAPAAVHFARIGDARMARELVSWMRSRLFDHDLGLYLDGIHLTQQTERLDRRVFTYNQGPIIAALLHLGEPADLEHLAQLITTVQKELTYPGQGLKLEQGGDGNLFTGILCRYLALAAQDTRLSPEIRVKASQLIEQTAVTLSNQHPERLSAAIQRTIVLFAAATVQPSTTNG